MNIVIYTKFASTSGCTFCHTYMNQANSHNRGSQVDPDTLSPINPKRRDQIRKLQSARKKQRIRRIGRLKKDGRLPSDFEDRESDEAAE